MLYPHTAEHPHHPADTPTIFFSHQKQIVTEILRNEGKNNLSEKKFA
jgi:hypothetical protein